ncbi:MAG: hypothetical protein NTX03_00615 [Bacteroidetes bacterium]|nr:hypothetical protein [Bacteroidota bacterium]
MKTFKILSVIVLLIVGFASNAQTVCFTNTSWSPWPYTVCVDRLYSDPMGNCLQGQVERECHTLLPGETFCFTGSNQLQVNPCGIIDVCISFIDLGGHEVNYCGPLSSYHGIINHQGTGDVTNVGVNGNTITLTGGILLH